jgi:hypothetical protein
MVWGMFPINPDISWEGHLWGAVSGVVLAIYYRKYIIRRDKFDWEDEEDDDDESENQNEELLLHPQKENESENNVSHTGKSGVNITFRKSDN